jgi:glutathione synthase
MSCCCGAILPSSGLGSAQKFEKVNFTRAVVESLERKVEYMRYYGRNFSNADLATL